MSITRCSKCGDVATSALVLMFKRDAWGGNLPDADFKAYTPLWTACTRHETQVRAELEQVRERSAAVVMPPTDWRIDQFMFTEPVEECAKCHDCGVKEGQLHQPGCDVDRCPYCGGQLMSCECANHHFYPGSARDFSQPPNRFTQADREHGRTCQAPDGECATCEAIEWKGTHGLPASVYFQGLHDEQTAEWERRLAEKGRVPFIVYPTMCCRCGALWPDMFTVPDEEWERYVAPAQRSEMLCRECYDWIKRVIDEARA